jgi:hypothetical protein
VSQSPFMTPDAGPVRARIERRAALVVIWLAHVPRALPPLAVVVVFFTGLLLPGIAGAVLLLVTVAVMALLSYLAWPSVPAQLRVIRLIILLAIFGFALSKLG